MITGVYPTEQDTIEIDGVKFSWALLPTRIHRSIQTRLVQFSGMTQEDLMKSGRMDEMLECFEDVVAFSVKGHSGFIGLNGKAIEFKTSRRTFKNEVYDAVDQDTLKAYYYSGVIEQLASKILDASQLTRQDQKN